MKYMKSSRKLILVALVSFVAGVWLYRVSTVKASPQKGGGGLIHVYKLDSSYLATGKFVLGDVVGFSCDAPSSCYLVTQ
jgi:hypothetical protein